MYFHAIGRNRYRVQKSKDDTEFYGTVEKQEYTSIDIETGKRTPKAIWKAYGKAGGWKVTSKMNFKTREEAGEFLIEDAKIPYNKKAMHWTKRQGESETLKASKEK